MCAPRWVFRTGRRWGPLKKKECRLRQRECGVVGEQEGRLRSISFPSPSVLIPRIVFDRLCQ
jgi:hypothetical protein